MKDRSSQLTSMKCLSSGWAATLVSIDYLSRKECLASHPATAAKKKVWKQVMFLTFHKFRLCALHQDKAPPLNTESASRYNFTLQSILLKPRADLFGASDMQTKVCSPVQRRRFSFYERFSTIQIS